MNCQKGSRCGSWVMYVH